MITKKICLRCYIALVGSSLLFGCNTEEQDFLSPEYKSPVDPIHIQLSDGLNMPTNLGGGFFSFSRPPVYLVAHENNVFDAYNTDRFGKVFSIDADKIDADDIVICYVDRNESWTVLHAIHNLLGTERKRIFVAYNQRWESNSHRELCEVEYETGNVGFCHAIQVVSLSNGRIIQRGVYGDFDGSSIFDARVYRNSRQEDCCKYPVYLLAIPDMNIESYLINLNILKSRADKSVLVGSVWESKDAGKGSESGSKGRFSDLSEASPRGAEGGSGSEEINP